MDLRETAHFFNVYMLVERSTAYLCKFGQMSFIKDMKFIQVDHAKSVLENKFLGITEHNASFHTRIALATENPFLIDLSIRTHNFARRLAYFVYATESKDKSLFADQQSKIVGEHEKIIELIELQKRSELVDVITNHAQRLCRRVANFVSGSSDEKISDIMKNSDFPNPNLPLN